MKEDPVLIEGKKGLMDFLKVSEKRVDLLLRLGLPGRREGRSLFFYPENVRNFLKAWASSRVRPEDENDTP